MSRDILYTIFQLRSVCTGYLSALVGFNLKSLWGRYLHFFNVCPFDYRAVAGAGNVWPLNSLTTYTSWVTVGLPTNRPKSKFNRCEIEHCGGGGFFVTLYLCIFTIIVVL